MGDDLNEIRAQLLTMREDLERESGLRASQDRDLADISTALRHLTTLVQAVNLNQMDDRRTLRQHTRDLHEIRTSLTGISSAVAALTGMLQTLIDREAGQQ